MLRPSGGSRDSAHFFSDLFPLMSAVPLLYRTSAVPSCHSCLLAVAANIGGNHLQATWVCESGHGDHCSR